MAGRKLLEGRRRGAEWEGPGAVLRPGGAQVPTSSWAEKRCPRDRQFLSFLGKPHTRFLHMVVRKLIGESESCFCKEQAAPGVMTSFGWSEWSLPHTIMEDSLGGGKESLSRCRQTVTECGHFKASVEESHAPRKYLHSHPPSQLCPAHPLSSQRV